MTQSNQKQSALVTGASSGIGKAVALRLARDGYHVIVHYRGGERRGAEALASIEKQGGSGELCRFDLADRAETRSVVEALCAHHDLHVLVSCAGVHDDELLVFMRDEQWDSVIEINLTAFFSLARPVVKHMLLRRSGRIIAIASTSGQSGLPGQTNYAAAKAGLLGAVKSLALECAKRNVLVNAVSPGFIATDMTAGLDTGAKAATVPLKRFGAPHEVAGAVSFLASDDAGYITGQVINVNGGVYM
jgi:3-oxoacyl-[acyl-carrier protein] reductase